MDRNGVKGLLWISSGTEFIRNSIMAAFLRRSLLTETRVAVGLVTAIGSAYVGAFVFNLTEQKRMARQIISGYLRTLNSEPLNVKFCPVSLTMMERKVSQEGSFVGIVGTKSSGISSALKLFSAEHANVIYVKMELGRESVCQVLYQRLQNSVWHLPSYFDSVRPRLSSDPTYVVTKVFNLVRKKTGQPVISLIDLNPPSKNSGGGNKPDPDARAFVREVKHLVSDDRIMKCVFASSEGACFHTEAAREPRLRLFTTGEIPLSTAKEYLKVQKGMTISDDVGELLLGFPRVFANLQAFAECYDQNGIENDIENAKLFVALAYMSEVAKIRSSFHCQNADMIYNKALEKGSVRVYDIIEAKLDEQQFHEFFLASNIFMESRPGQYVFQFGCTAKAAKEHLQKMKK